MGKENKKTQTSIGGQAVIEGVMMRGKTAMATAVRDERGEILLETKILNRIFCVLLPVQIFCAGTMVQNFDLRPQV